MIHERGYWLDNKQEHIFDKSLANGIIEVFPVKTIVDIGCGDGSYVQNYQAHGFGCIGYDGNPVTEGINDCFVSDFTESLDIGKFELVLSLEVGEHIPEKYEQVFIDNLCHAASKWIVLSWAVPGQRSFDITKFPKGNYPQEMHVNCRENWYVIQQMRKRDFEFNVELTQVLREKSTLPWFKYTIMVYEWKK